MHIQINDNTTIREIQETFSDFYPYLQLVFYHKPHKKYEVSGAGELIPPDTIVGEIRKTHISTIIEIQPLYKVRDVEKEFQERLNLPVQVLWKEMKNWKLVSEMDDFTLKELNEMARNSSDDYIIDSYEEGFEDKLD